MVCSQPRGVWWFEKKYGQTRTQQEAFMAKRTTDVETRIEILLKLAVIPDVTIHAPSVSVENDTVTLGGIVDAFWKRSYIAGILASELPDRQIQNNLIVAMACFTDAACKSGDESFFFAESDGKYPMSREKKRLYCHKAES